MDKKYQEKPLRELTFAIVGLGLIGGSYAKALRNLKVRKILGMDISHGIARACLNANMIDEVVESDGSNLQEADVIIYAGSLVNPKLLDVKKEGAKVFNSAEMTLEEVLSVMYEAEDRGQTVVRLHTGDPCLYGAIREQMDALDAHGIAYDYTPGVSAFCGAAAALNMEYTLPGVSQSVVITRMAGRTPVPEHESVRSFAAHKATMVLFLSTGLLEKTQEELIEGGYDPETPAAIVYKATWPDERTFICTVGTLAQCAKENGVKKTALIIVGDTVAQSGYARSELYNPTFATEFRPAKE